MPFAGYKNMAECIQAHSDKADPKAYCAAIMKKAEKDSSMLSCWMCERASFATRDSLEDHAEAVHTHSEVHELLRDAIRKEHGKDNFLRDAADDWVVWASYADDLNDDKLLKASYTISDNGAVTLGKPVEVRRKTTYPQVPGGDETAWLQMDVAATYECKDCSKTFKSLKAMTEHYRNAHDYDGGTAAKRALSSKTEKSSLDTSKDYSTEKRKEMEKKGWAMSGGKFPIADCGDVGDAISRLGQQKGVSNAAVKKHIKKRAKALGCTNKLPDDW